MTNRSATATCSLLLLSFPAFAQQSTIRSTTRLVQVSVVALDNHGNPITGLTKENFTLTDEGHPQNISVFAAETPAPSTPVPPLPFNVFTNRFDLKGQNPGAVTIILFDALNTSFADQSVARKQILKFLQTLQPQDHVAIYALTDQLVILHDFTLDSAALVSAVSHFSPEETAAFEASTPAFINLVSLTGNSDWAMTQSRVNNANNTIADQKMADRVATTANALEAIANHVSVIPGRKSLVWVSGGFPLQMGLGTLGSGDRNVQSNNPDATRSARALNRSNISIYPVDVHGVELNAGFDPSQRGPGTGRGTNDSFFTRQNRLDSFRLLADRTGGVAFYGNNDIRAGIRRAFDDGRYTYTIGFYPDHNKWDGRFREIKIQVHPRTAQLRYRKGYLAVAQGADTEALIQTDLEEAAVSPLESTALGMVVAVKAISSPDERTLELRVTLDPKQFLLDAGNNHRKGALDLMFIQNSSTGQVLKAESQHFDLNLDDQQYAHMSTAGTILLRHLTVAPQAAQIRIIVRDARSRALGSVAVPTEPFYPVESASAPAALRVVPSEAPVPHP